MLPESSTHLESLPELPTGVRLIHDPARNKGTAFTESEREALGLRGLLPPRPASHETQVARVLENFRRKSNDLERYIFLTALQDRNERLFLQTVVEHIETMMPIVYTPTVGEACKQYAHIFRRPRGMYLSAADRGRVRDVLENWPRRNVAVIVMTDGGRILGLGDLGANGMGIPIGKLNLYTACGGLDPARCLPIQLDVGTNNEDLLEDPFYLGTPERRIPVDEYDEFLEEVMEALTELFPGALIQFEDFATRNAFTLLERYRGRYRVFNDDVQGTASVVLGALYSAARARDVKLTDERVLFLGAGGAGVGIAELLVEALRREGLEDGEARERCWLFDSKGLVVRDRDDLAPHKLPFAQDARFTSSLRSAIESIRPTTLVGVSGSPGIFSRPVLEAMATHVERPLILALSNPTSRSECTPREAYEWTKGRALVATGSPFDPVRLDGKTHVPGQCNNCYVFPGIGLGVVAARAPHVTDDMFVAAARALAQEVSKDRLDEGCLLPPIADIRQVSAAIATAVARVAAESELAPRPIPDDTRAWIESLMFDPAYPEYC